VRSVRRWAGPGVAVGVLAIAIWRIGGGPFVAGLKAVDGRAVLAAAAVVLVTTLCSAWRWTVVARGLGVRLSLRAAVAAYYRALFLNLTLPGGVAGDVHRGVRHGRDVDDVGRALRAVVWERAAGQVVQVALTIQVDSVRKHGEDDSVIPANVADAINFYQSRWMIHGRSMIFAADPSFTTILGNLRFEYQKEPLACHSYPWYDRVFFKGHTSIECDPQVWSQVENLIEARVSATAKPAQAEAVAQIGN